MQNKWVWMAPCLAAAVLSGTACKKKDNASNEKVVAKETGSAGAMAKTPEAKPAGNIGINNPANDPKVVAAAKQLMTDCGKTLDESTNNDKKPNQKKSYYSCEKWGADFGDQQFEKADATFVNFLEDPDVKVRAIGVSGLGKGWDWHSNKELAAKVVDALKKEKAPSPIDHNLALRVADLSSDAGQDDAIKAIAIDPNTSKDVKLAILAWWHGDKAYEAVKANAASTDPDVQNAVVQGYVLHFKDHTEEACTYWADHLATTNEQANEYALGHMTGGWGGNTTGDSESEDYISGGGGGPSSSDDKRCSEAQLGKALDEIQKEWDAGKTDSKLTYALAFLAKDKLTPKPIKDRTNKLLMAMVEKKDQWLRSSALRALVEADPKNKTYAKKFAKDEDLKSTVEDLLKPEKK
ncbi:MAG TPA: hypothetical protein VL326_15750 [Kofleriaceae bacterium]|nr:hypothetical protein [Kofleriaceae bacterium]